jgi:hypothetical protein
MGLGSIQIPFPTDVNVFKIMITLIIENRRVQTEATNEYQKLVLVSKSGSIRVLQRVLSNSTQTDFATITIPSHAVEHTAICRTGNYWTLVIGGQEFIPTENL